MVPPLDVWLDSYRQSPRTALRLAADHGYHGVQAAAQTGPLAAEELSRSGRRELRRYLVDLGLTLDGLVLFYPGAGLADPAQADARIAQLRRTLELCRDVGVPQAGVTLRGWSDEKRRSLAEELLGVIAEQADRTGVAIGVDAGREAAQAAEALTALRAAPLGLVVDTASLPADTVDANVLPRVQTIHLRDVREHGERVEEVDFGAGQVDFRQLLSTLSATAPSARLVVRRDAARAVDALRTGREYIASLLAR